MAERLRQNREILSSSLSPSARTEVGILEQQAAGQSQITKLLNTMSGFFYDQMQEKVVEEGEQYGATNPITLKELEKMEQGENITARFGYGLRGKAARKAAFGALQNEIEIEASKDYQTYIMDAKLKNLPIEEVADGLDAITIGYTSKLKEVDAQIGLNTKARLSQLTNSHFSSYAADLIKKQKQNEQLKLIRNTEQEIDTIPVLLKNYIRNEPPNVIVTQLKNLKNRFNEQIMNSNLEANDKLKYLKDGEDRIDESIIRGMVEYHQDQGLDLNTLIDTKQTNPYMKNLYSMLSPKTKSNYVDKINNKLTEINNENSIQSKQTETLINLSKDKITQKLNRFFNQFTPGMDVPDDIINTIQKLKMVDRDVAVEYEENVADIDAGFSINVNQILTKSLDKKVNDGTLEFTDIKDNLSKLTAEQWEEYRKKALDIQMTEIKDFKEMVVSQPSLHKVYPEFAIDYSQIIRIPEREQEKRTRQQTVEAGMRQLAKQAKLKQEPFDPDTAYQQVIKGLPKFISKSQLEEQANKATLSVITDIAGKSSILRDAKIITDDMNIVDNLEFYQEFERRYKQFNGSLARIIKSKKDTGLSSTEFTNIISKVRERIRQLESGDE
jgi:hypothetical protein